MARTPEEQKAWNAARWQRRKDEQNARRRQADATRFATGTPEFTSLTREGTIGGDLERAILALWAKKKAAGEIPTSLRFMMYELEQVGQISKLPGPRSTANDRMSRAATKLRKLGLIPWADIVDETRHADEWDSAPTIYQYMLDRLEEARLDAWVGGTPPLVLCEDRGTAGVLRPTAYLYLCPIAGTAGPATGFMHTKVAKLEPERVLYLGDLDRGGGRIERSNQRELEAELGRTVEWEHLAITEEQAAATGKPPIHKRYDDGTEMEVYEVEALGQAGVTRILRERLDDLLPEPLEDVLDREKKQHDRVVEKLSDLSDEPEDPDEDDE